MKTKDIKNLKTAPYIGLAIGLAEGITISHKSLSAAVPVDEYNSAFRSYLHF